VEIEPLRRSVKPTGLVGRVRVIYPILPAKTAKRAAKSLTACLCCQSVGSQFAKDNEVLVGEGFNSHVSPQ
jgi:hypothetical protein